MRRLLTFSGWSLVETIFCKSSLVSLESFWGSNQPKKHENIKTSQLLEGKVKELQSQEEVLHLGWVTNMGNTNTNNTSNTSNNSNNNNNNNNNNHNDKNKNKKLQIVVQLSAVQKVFFGFYCG